MTETRVATIGELEASLSPIGATSEFLNSQLREGASMMLATARWAGILAGENRDLRSKVQGLESEKASLIEERTRKNAGTKPNGAPSAFAGINDVPKPGVEEHAVKLLS